MTWAWISAAPSKMLRMRASHSTRLIWYSMAWAVADNALQIHGGNGYALEFEISRVLCDARILNIFEGAAEIQAQVVARGLLAARGQGRLADTGLQSHPGEGRDP